MSDLDEFVTTWLALAAVDAFFQRWPEGCVPVHRKSSIEEAIFRFTNALPPSIRAIGKAESDRRLGELA